VRGQESDQRHAGAGHRPGHAGAGHIGQRPVGGRAAARHVRRGRPVQPAAHPRVPVQRVLRARPGFPGPDQPGGPGPVGQLSAAGADRRVLRVPVADEAQSERQPDRPDTGQGIPAPRPADLARPERVRADGRRGRRVRRPRRPRLAPAGRQPVDARARSAHAARPVARHRPAPQRLAVRLSHGRHAPLADRQPRSSDGRGTRVLGSGSIRRLSGEPSAGSRTGVRAGRVSGRAAGAGRGRGRECVVPVPGGRHTGGHGRMAVRRRARLPAQRVRADHRGR